MSSLRISGGVTIDLLVNGDNLNTTLNATAPLYQTFRKGTSDYSPNWGEMPDAERPVIFPRVYSVMEGRTLIPADAGWKYNGVAIEFDSGGIATTPEAVQGKLRRITHSGVEALKVIGNLASETNNDSDIITFSGRVDSSGQSVMVSVDVTVLIEEAVDSLYRLFLNMDDDVLDPGETNLTLKAILFNNGSHVVAGVEFEFLDIDGTVLRAKGPGNTLTLTASMIDSELLVTCKAYVDDELVATGQRQVWDATDPFVIVCDQGSKVRQKQSADLVYTFMVLNARTGVEKPGATFTFGIYRNSDLADIASQFAKTATTVTVTGVKMMEHKSIYLDASCTLTV